MEKSSLMKTVFQVLGELPNRCYATGWHPGTPHLIRTDGRDTLTAFYRCGCGSQWHCGWHPMMRPSLAPLADLCPSGHLAAPRELDASHRSVRADWSWQDVGLTDGTSAR